MDVFRRSASSSNNSETHSLKELYSPSQNEAVHPLMGNVYQHHNTSSTSGPMSSSTTKNAKVVAAGLGGTSRSTAQMEFNVLSEPSSLKQLRALTVKNFKVRIRDLAQTINAVFQPVWMMLVLVFLHLSAKDASNHMAVKALPYLSHDTCKSTTDCTYFGYTGVPSTDPIITELSSFFAASEPQSVVPKYFESEQAMSTAYDVSPVNFVVGVIFVTPSTNLTTVAPPPSSGTNDPTFTYRYTIMANHTAHAKHEYVSSRFATAQAYIERAAINLHRKANNKPPLSSPLPLKSAGDPGIGITGAGRTFISYANFVGLGTSINSALNAFYVIFCFQAVWLGVLDILVVEKSKRIRSTMSMMGLNSNAYLASIWLMQNIQNLVTCALMLFILFVGRIFTRTNAFIVYLLLILFSFNVTAIGTIASVLVQDPKKTNTVNFLLLGLTVGSYGICSALVYGRGAVDPTTETLIFLIPSVALGRAINYITGVEAALGGVTFDNLASGPCGKALWMMALDCVLFYFLAWYMDAVFPGEYGSALPFDFFLRRSYWGIGQYERAADKPNVVMPRAPSARQNALQQQQHQGGHEAHADMFEDFDITRVPVEDRGVIQVTNLRKSFTSPPGYAYYLPIIGLFLQIFYPPSKSTKTSGPLAGIQKKEVVSGVDLEIHRNEIFGFLGHNGAGKTTSLSMIMGALNPTAGTIVVNGHLMPGSEGIKRREMDLRTLAEVQKQMGVCPQHDVLFDTLTAWETIQLYAAIKGVRVVSRKSTPAETRARLDGNADSNGTSSSSDIEKSILDEYLAHLLEDVYLREKKHERVVTFSGGMKRKLSVALAFLGDPKVVLLDEPTTGMDEYTKKSIWQLMQDSKAGRTILLTTHSMEEADALSDRIAILSHGKLQTLGSSLFLKNRFGVGYRLSLEKRRVMLSDQDRDDIHPKGYGEQQVPTKPSSQWHGNNSENIDEQGQTILFDEAKTTEIVKKHFPDATIDVNTSTDIVYVLPTTGTMEQRSGRTAQEYIRDKKAALPGLFEHLDQEIAANRLGVKSVGLSLTTLEEVFVNLQQQDEAEKAAKDEAEAAQ
ncbi:hypothetical protein BX616_000950 [Lobosporangium transversale]|uniref:ABC transporter domain-containing protein n=1 Tax=Lobosporangium transversale TaxID=64571 RepID=A0A1Y2GVX4_9FUNG|nr:hypothetical protein BCR41DRAFT_222129 [Lobosporangium transversale]KAF9917451.1 hypothetical protein BX616_000950 [Lobosporangium transversale]ORZ26405.1 hypothetical protein BCR41DRAFT_222129 [Lobosporangium transversale]|eukprot:XP_021884170.1 hypothetical protein BCR41DRAFT_222129 [Lobosporangium transversale]